jgi:hypothetical protein
VIDGRIASAGEKHKIAGAALSRIRVIARKLLMQRSLLIEGILEDYPKALTALRKMGCYQRLESKL